MHAYSTRNLIFYLKIYKNKYCNVRCCRGGSLLIDIFFFLKVKIFFDLFWGFLFFFSFTGGVLWVRNILLVYSSVNPLEAHFSCNLNERESILRCVFFNKKENYFFSFSKLFDLHSPPFPFWVSRFVYFLSHTHFQ